MALSSYLFPVQCVKRLNVDGCRAAIRYAVLNASYKTNSDQQMPSLRPELPRCLEVRDWMPWSPRLATGSSVLACVAQRTRTATNQHSFASISTLEALQQRIISGPRICAFVEILSVDLSNSAYHYARLTWVISTATRLNG